MTKAKLHVGLGIAISAVAGSAFSQVSPDDCVDLFQGVLSSTSLFRQEDLLRRKDTYLWDNWVIRDKRTGHYRRYSLSAPTHVGDNTARHTHARIRVFSSVDGKKWVDRGLVVDDALTWSGHTAQTAKGDYLLFHTRSTILENDIHQKIAIAESKDGLRFSPSRTLIDPWDAANRPQLEKLGYYLDAHNGAISAWRDPYLFEDTLYFAVRKKSPDGKIGLAVGRARFADQDFTRSPEFLEPLELPLGPEIRELEVPNLKRLKDGRFLMSVNLTDRASPAASTHEVNSWVRFFVGDSPEGPWKPAKGPQLDAEGNLFVPADQVYGFNLLRTEDKADLRGAGFFRSGGQEPHTLTPLVVTIVE